MRRIENVELPPMEQVQFLGVPLRVYAKSPRERSIHARARLVFGLASLIAGFGLVAAFTIKAPVDARASILIAATAGAIGGLPMFIGTITVISTLADRSSGTIFAFYHDALAYRHNEEWLIVEWFEIERYYQPSLRSIYPILRLRDGTRLILRHDMLATPALFFLSIYCSAYFNTLPVNRYLVGGLECHRT